MNDDNPIRNVNIVIADRSYPLKVRASEEETLRKAAEVVREKMVAFRKSYGGQEKLDYLAMAALKLSIELLNVKKTDTQSLEVSEKLDNLNDILSAYIEPNQ